MFRACGTGRTASNFGQNPGTEMKVGTESEMLLLSTYCAYNMLRPHLQCLLQIPKSRRNRM